MAIFHRARIGETTVAAPRSAGDASLTVLDGVQVGSQFPAWVIAIRGATRLCVLEVTGRAGDVLTVAGAVDGTTDRDLGVGDLVRLGPTPGAVNELQDAHDALETTVAGFGDWDGTRFAVGGLLLADGPATVKAQIGTSRPLYLMADNPTLGHNAYYSAGWHVGAGGGYSAAVDFSAGGDGTYRLYCTAGSGAADAGAALVQRLAMFASGNAVIGTQADQGARLFLDTASAGNRGLAVCADPSQTAPLAAFQGISSTGVRRDLGFVDAGFVVATDATRTGFVTLSVADWTGTVREGVRVASDSTQAVVTLSGQLKIGTLTGMLKATAGVVSVGAAGTDYLTPADLAAKEPAWTAAQVAGSDATTTGQSLVDAAGLSVAAAAAATYEVEAVLLGTTSADTTGTKYGVQFSAAGASCAVIVSGAVTSTTGGITSLNALNSASATAFLTASAQAGVVVVKGVVITGANPGNITVQHLKVTSGTSTIKVGSVLRARRLA